MWSEDSEGDGWEEDWKVRRLEVLDVIIPYGEDARKRHYHKAIRGKVEKFMVQLEVKCEGNWKEVVR